jgi:Rho family protein
VASKWIEEISENVPGVKLVLTALKCDLRKDEYMNDNPNVITYEQGLAKAKEIGAVKYLGKASMLFWSERPELV